MLKLHSILVVLVVWSAAISSPASAADHIVRQLPLELRLWAAGHHVSLQRHIALSEVGIPTRNDFTTTNSYFVVEQSAMWLFPQFSISFRMPPLGEVGGRIVVK